MGSSDCFSWVSLCLAIVTLPHLENLFCRCTLMGDQLKPLDSSSLIYLYRFPLEITSATSIPGCMWGSSNKSLTVAMLEPSECLTSTGAPWWGLWGFVIMGALASIVVLFLGPVPRSVKFYLWILFQVWIEFQNSDGSIVSTCVSSGCEGKGLTLSVQPD